MAIEVTIGNKPYKLATEVGQEDRVRSVAALLDGFVAKIQEEAGNSIDRDRMLVMAGLMLADDYRNLQEEYDEESDNVEDFMINLSERLEKLAL